MACDLEDNRKRIADDPERNRSRVKAWQKANPIKHAAKTTAHFRKKKYGLGADELNAMLHKQEGLCGICHQPFGVTPHVDHDHATGIVRGLLCGPCNRGLGMFKDSKIFLLNAIRYLK